LRPTTDLGPDSERFALSLHFQRFDNVTNRNGCERNCKNDSGASNALAIYENHRGRTGRSARG
jgi:hypothetical protein